MMTREEAINRIKDHSYDVIVPDKLPCERYKEAPEVKARVPLSNSTKKVIRQLSEELE